MLIASCNSQLANHDGMAHPADLCATSVLPTAVNHAKAMMYVGLSPVLIMTVLWCNVQSVLAGRDGRAFGAAASLKKNKSGGLSEKEKQKRKQLPLRARLHQLQTRNLRNKMNHKPKHQKGHVRS